MATSYYILNEIFIDSPFVGKYFNVNTYYSRREKQWYSSLCYCIRAAIMDDTIFFTVKTQSGTEYKVREEQILDEIIANPQPKYSIGQNVLAEVNSHMNEDIEYYCRIENVITFCNNVSYEILIIRQNKKIIVEESSIKKLATLKTPKFQSGIYIAVKTYHGYGYNNDYTIKNGVITKINQWFDSVTYDVTFDDNTVKTEVYEDFIMSPYTPPLSVDKKVLLKTREQELLEELELIRMMMTQ
jgi:hypothetical protein